jgi:hypothetical protein
MIDVLFTSKARAKEHRPDSFAEQQANHAKHAIDIQTSLGERLVENLQGIRDQYSSFIEPSDLCYV